MTRIKRIIASIQGLNWSRYWVIYYITYLGAFAWSVGHYWERLFNDKDPVFLWAAVLGVSAGAALTITISVEVLIGGYMLLIPAAWNYAVQRGVQRGVQRQLDREAEAYRRFGIDVDGVRVLPDTLEVRRFLAGESENGRSSDA